jgi:hypothetical protein
LVSFCAFAPRPTSLGPRPTRRCRDLASFLTARLQAAGRLRTPNWVRFTQLACGPCRRIPFSSQLASFCIIGPLIAPGVSKIGFVFHRLRPIWRQIGFIFHNRLPTTGYRRPLIGFVLHETRDRTKESMEFLFDPCG